MTIVRADRDSEAAPRPLSRNRNYNILWSGQLLSELAAEIVLVAVPLLILAMHGSPLELGAAASVSAVAGMLAVVPAGDVRDALSALCDYVVTRTS